jgi:hypothetical protein
MASTLVLNHGASPVLIPPTFGGGIILPSGFVVCESDPLTVQSAFTASNVGLQPGNVAFTAVQDGQAGALPLLATNPMPGIFVSPVETGTGAVQNIAHGLGVTPAAVVASPTNNTGAESFAISESSQVTVGSATFTAGVDATGSITIASGSGAVGATIAGHLITVVWATSDAATATALEAAINAASSVNTLVVATNPTAGEVVLTALAAGTGGNAITLVASGTGASVSGAHLTGGAMAYDTVIFAGGNASTWQIGADINGVTVTVPWTTSDSNTGALFAAAVNANATLAAEVAAVNASGTVTVTSIVNGRAPNAYTAAAVGGGHNATDVVLTVTSGLLFKVTAYA